MSFTKDQMTYAAGQAVQANQVLGGIGYQNVHNRIVLTDQQMTDRGLFYDAIRGGIVKVEKPPVLYNVCSDGQLTGKGFTGVILDDPHNDVPSRGKKFKIPKKDYNTVGMRFLRGANIHKVYTYKIPKKAKVHLGMELVVPSPFGNSTAAVVEIHKTPEDTGPFTYKFVVGKVVQL